MAQFLVQRACEGCKFRLYDHEMQETLRSTAIRTDDLAVSAIEWLKGAITNDWLYVISATRQGLPYFSITIAKTKVVCTSPEYRSCEVMERAIASLKIVAAHAPIVFTSSELRASAPTSLFFDQRSRARADGFSAREA